MRDMYILWSNVLWSVTHFFSLPVLAATLFAPWKRLSEETQKGAPLSDFFSNLIVNIIMRIIGALMRTSVIIIGLLSVSLTFIGALISLIVWILLPVIIGYLVYIGVLLFN